MNRIIVLAVIVVINRNVLSQTGNTVFPGADELTPSKTMYCDWLNSEWPGSNEHKTLTNLDFFKWLHDEYGMELDIYLLDAGNIDGNGGLYTSLESIRFKSKYPGGLKPLYEKVRSFGCRLGIWLGPDGYGNTPEEAAKRTDMLVELCEKYNFGLFKFDRACSDLREEKEKHFVNSMTQCRKRCPDLIALNHRIRLSEAAKKHMSTVLWQGLETYIDVHMANKVTAPHHRAVAVSRGLVPGLRRLAEDCGVCISSCPDYWEDDLVLQAFSRNLILAPEIYGNPWLLKDEEFPKLARIFNLHKKYNRILVKGLVLPAEQYGPHAVSRGDGVTRLVTLRNLTWAPVKYTVDLDETIGLVKGDNVTVVQHHPTERFIGNLALGSKVEVEVLPFRSCLVMITANRLSETVVNGCDYEIMQDVSHKPLQIRLLGYPGKEYKIDLKGNYREFSSAQVDGKNVPRLLEGKSVEVEFSGEAFNKPYHRKIGEMAECRIPEDAEAIYESTCFAADNNPLEVRSLNRSGETLIMQVKRARNAFFNHYDFVCKESWDKYMFDGNWHTSFTCRVYRGDQRINNGALRLDLGKVTDLETLRIQVANEDDMQKFPEDTQLVEVSNDLTDWRTITSVEKGKSRLFIKGLRARYLRIFPVPLHIAEIIGLNNNEHTDRDDWRASNLFSLYNDKFKAIKAWTYSFTLDEIPKASYLCIAINGRHGVEGAYAAIKIADRYIGSPDRSPSFPSNVWEYPVRKSDRNYTYYVPLDKNMINKKIEAYVLGFNKDHLDFEPAIWVTAYPIPFEEKVLTLYR
ncbi:MAG: alpha-amylase family protein [Planctomycetota bacterium]|jgi:hypothetical protein